MAKSDMATQDEPSVPLKNPEECELKGDFEVKELEPKNKRRYGGLIFAILSSLFFSLTGLLAKLLQQNGHHPFVVTMYRYAGILLPSIPIAVYFHFKNVKIFETLYPIGRETWDNLIKYLLQGILGCTGIIFRFISFQYIPIADSTVVFSASTVVVTILAHFCLGEKCGVVSVLLALTTAIGVIIIARPPLISGESDFNLEFLTGTAFAVAALLFTAIFLIVMRKIRKTHFTLMMLVGGAWGVFEAGLLALTLGVFTLPENLIDLGLMIGLALLTFLGQTCIVFAIKFENAGPLSIARTTEAIFAFVWQYLVLGIAPDFISLLGGSIVLTAVIVTGYCKYLDALPTDDSLRKSLSFMLK